MASKGQTGIAAIWGAGCILLALGIILFVSSLKEQRVGIPELALPEAILGAILVVFAVISFYLAHK